MILLPPPDPTHVLFETQLIEELSGKTREAHRLGNRITCGTPVAYDLVALYADQNQKLPFELRTQLERYEFWLLRLACTLHTAPNSVISWAKFAVSFAHRSQMPATAQVLHPLDVASLVLSDPADPPVAYDFHPKQVVDTVQVEETVEISPSFKFGEASISLGKDAVAVKYQELRPRITGYGKGESEIYWRFTPGSSNNVEEGVKEMDVIVRKHRGTAVQSTIQIEGQGKSWGIVPSPVELDSQRFYF